MWLCNARETSWLIKSDVENNYLFAQLSLTLFDGVGAEIKRNVHVVDISGFARDLRWRYKLPWNEKAKTTKGAQEEKSLRMC